MAHMAQSVPTDAILMMARAPRLDFDQLCAQINARLGDPEHVLGVGNARGKDFALLTHPDFHVLISANRKRVARASVVQALSAPISKLRSPDYDRLFARHCAHVAITVGEGPMHYPDGTEEVFAEAGIDTRGSGVSMAFRLRVLKAAMDAMRARHAPILVHWTQSDMLYSAQELDFAPDFDLPVALATHPLPTAGLADDGGTPPLGVIALHSDALAGQTITVDPNPRDFADSLNMAVSMMIEKHAGRLTLAHGDQLTTEAGDTFFVRHEAPDALTPAGRICLSMTKPDGPAPTIPVPQTPAPMAGDADQAETSAFDPAPVASGDKSFQDRINRLRAKAAPAPAPASNPDDPYDGLPAPSLNGLDTLRDKPLESSGFSLPPIHVIVPVLGFAIFLGYSMFVDDLAKTIGSEHISFDVQGPATGDFALQPDEN